MNKGKIVQIIGPVVTEFPENSSYLQRLKVDFASGKAQSLTLEVQHHLGGNWVRSWLCPS